jgi:multiple sugar transport system substrate-binding protein
MSGGWKRIALVVTFTALLVTIFGGSRYDASASGETRDADTLSIMGFGTPDEIATVRVDRAKRAIAPAELQLIRGGFDQQQFLSSVAAGRPPDLIYMDRQLIGTFANRGAIVPLTTCIRSQKINMKQYRATAVKEVTFKGRVYGIPEFYTSRVVYINNTALASAKVKTSDVDGSNWNRLRRASVKLMRGSGSNLSRIGFDPKLPEFFPLWAKANGHEILSRDGRRARLNHPKAIEALTFAYSLIRQHGGWGGFKSFRDTHDFFGARNAFARNQLGASPLESWYLNVLAKNSPQVNITLVPFKNRKGQPINWATGNTWAIPKGADNQREACAWMKAMTRWEAWVAAARARVTTLKRNNEPFTGLYTGNKIADQRVLNRLYEKSGKKGFDNGVKTLVRVQKYSFTMPASPAGAEFQTAWRDAVNRVLSGQQSPAAALRQAQREAQAALNRATG